MLRFLTGTTGMVATGAGAVVLAAAAYQFLRPAPLQSPQAAPQEVALAAPSDDSAAVAPAAGGTPSAPTFDEVRQEPDGMTIIAGSAAPLSQVQVLQDGTKIASAQADARGKFAAIALVVPDGKGHVLSLLQMLDGVEVASADQIILAPQHPVQTARVAVGQPSQEAAAQPAPQTDVAQVAAPDAADVAPRVAATATADSAAHHLPAQPDAPRQVAVLRTTQTGVELLNTSEPLVMDSVALDTISYSAQGDVQLAGRAQPDTDSVRVYLDNSSVINLAVDPSGRWRGDLPGVDEGIYTLRVDAVSQTGRVTSRVETPFKREAPEVLAQAAAAQNGPLKQITVQKGATLWGIAEERYGSGLLFVNVFEANGEAIRDPNLIYPGQIFTLPEDES